MRSLQQNILTSRPGLQNESEYRYFKDYNPVFFEVYCPFRSMIFPIKTLNFKTKSNNWTILRRPLSNNHSFLKSKVGLSRKTILPITNIENLPARLRSKFLYYEIVSTTTRATKSKLQPFFFGAIDQSDILRIISTIEQSLRRRPMCLFALDSEAGSWIHNNGFNKFLLHEVLVASFIFGRKFVNLTRPDLIYDDFMVHAILRNGGFVDTIKKVADETRMIKLSNFHGYLIKNHLQQVVDFRALDIHAPTAKMATIPSF